MLTTSFYRIDCHTVDLLDQMLILNPARRITAHKALEHDYFKAAPAPCLPSALPKIELETHEFQVKNRLRIEQARLHDQKGGPAVIGKKPAVTPCNGVLQTAVKRPLPEQAIETSKAMEPPTHKK